MSKESEKTREAMNLVLREIIKESNIESVVKRNGQLVVATNARDYDEEGNFIGDYSHLHIIAEPFVRKYNPDNLSFADYQAAYEKGKLPWQIIQ